MVPFSLFSFFPFTFSEQFNKMEIITIKVISKNVHYYQGTSVSSIEGLCSGIKINYARGTTTAVFQPEALRIPMLFEEYIEVSVYFVLLIFLISLILL
jgi:hypothetical protein